ncbi:hypothetical protein L6452_19103 [Arctium lappa]|uniref:Uncharacterized protein n=1 Tax=Arctium lappa TaxID=4217 RepID=A0ACB9B902_ARCLA|nr:hypothetical protein L6452_19103 [Arctium lappa]
MFSTPTTTTVPPRPPLAEELDLHLHMHQVKELGGQKFQYGLNELDAQMVRSFSWSYTPNVPQQSGPLGDCRPWEFKLISDLVDRNVPSCSADIGSDCMSWRHHMEDVI